MKLTYYRWSGRHLMEMRTFDKVYFDTVPKLTYEFDLFNVEVDAQEITLELYYNADFADETGTDRQQWNWWHKQNYEQIGAMKLMKDDGNVLFEGVLDTEADRIVCKDDKKLTLTYLGMISYQLDKTLSSLDPSLEITTGFYPYIFGGSTGGAIYDLFLQFFDRFLSGFEFEMPDVENWENASPVTWYYMQSFTGNFYMGYRVLWDGDKTVSDALKDLLALAGFRVVFYGQKALFYSYRNGYRMVEPDGKLVEVEYVNTKQNDLASNLDANGLYSLNGEVYFRRSTDGVSLDYEAQSEYALICIAAWLQQYPADRSRRYTYVGYNTNLAIANMFPHVGETVIVTKIIRDLRYIEADMQPVEIEAEVIYAD